MSGELPFTGRHRGWTLWQTIVKPDLEVSTVPYMIKREVYFSTEELKLLETAARRSERSTASLIREAVRRVWLRPAAEGPIALWEGPTAHGAMEHDMIYCRVD